MSKLGLKVTKIGKTLYEHKKKTVFFTFLGYLGVDWVQKWLKNEEIRSFYAKKAVVYGKQTISPDHTPRRIFVLANVDANQRACYDNFTKNALPLFHLAGIQVDIMKAESEEQMEALAGALDKQEADAIYVVGGDGTIGKVVTGIFRNREKAPLPVGFYPGGYDNLWLKSMVPSVFAENTQDVRAACESAMAVINEKKRDVYAFEVLLEDAEKPEYGLSDVRAGWYRQIEEKRKKLWYFSVLRRRWAYVWEMLKRSPQELAMSIEYEEPCSGCEKCRPKPILEAPTWRWWHVLTGAPRYKNEDAVRDYTGIVNPNCGKVHRLDATATDLLIENEQKEDYNQLRCRIGGTGAGRFTIISDGWRRCANDVVGQSPNPQFYANEIEANAIRFKINDIPEYIRRIYVSSTATGSEIVDKWLDVRSTQKKLSVFLPETVEYQS